MQFYRHVGRMSEGNKAHCKIAAFVHGVELNARSVHQRVQASYKFVMSSLS